MCSHFFLHFKLPRIIQFGWGIWRHGVVGSVIRRQEVVVQLQEMYGRLLSSSSDSCTFCHTVKTSCGKCACIPSFKFLLFLHSMASICRRIPFEWFDGSSLPLNPPCLVIHLNNFPLEPLSHGNDLGDWLDLGILSRAYLNSLWGVKKRDSVFGSLSHAIFIFPLHSIFLLCTLTPFIWRKVSLLHQSAITRSKS